MRFFASLLFALILVGVNPIRPQQTPLPVLKDTQAVNLVSQALAMAGGKLAINAIDDYTATGQIIYHFAQDAQGAVTVRACGFDQIRIDANLPAGVRSQISNRGEDAIRTEDGAVGWSGIQTPFAPTRLILPQLLLATALDSPGYKLSYLGLKDLEGHSVHDVQLQLIQFGEADSRTEYRTIEFFLDASTFQILMMQDTVPRSKVRQVRYSGYKFASGILVPSSIKESIDHRATWEIQLANISLNSGLTDFDFQL